MTKADTPDKTTVADGPAPVIGAGARVVILGAGIAGLEAAKRLGKRGVPVTIIDRHNHHLFQPLLYQVATAALSAPDIAEPIRSILRRYRSVEVLLGDIVRIDTGERRVFCAHGAVLPYDYLIIATGARTGYFGHDDWEAAAPGLKTVEDAINIRNRVLTLFEQAERCTDPKERARLMTIAVIGGGPTGVELCGAISELARHTLVRDYRHIRPASMQIMLIEGGPRLLAEYDAGLSDYATQALQKLGVSVRTGDMVEAIEAARVTVAGTDIPVGLVIWAAGVSASPLASQLDAETDKAGRIMVDSAFEVIGQERVFAVGDIAHFKDRSGAPLPGLAQVAKQQGDHLGRGLAALIQDNVEMEPFIYRSRGNTAIIGRNAAVYETGNRRIKGRPAWFLWVVVHVWLLAGVQNTILVTIKWIWRYATYQRGARLILRPQPGPAAAILAEPDGTAQEKTKEKTQQEARRKAQQKAQQNAKDG